MYISHKAASKSVRKICLSSNYQSSSLNQSFPKFTIVTLNLLFLHFYLPVLIVQGGVSL
jgi:hypothetical protein